MKIKYVSLILIATSLSLVASFSAAQTGVQVPCVNCEQYTKRTEPFRGMWYNKDQTAQGFSIDVQNGRLFGVYYGYNQAGDAIWQTFVGDLVPSAEPDIMWTVNTTLNQFSNSNCFNCEIKGFDIAEGGSIQVKFRHKNYASISIDNGAEQHFTPFVFGVGAVAEFPAQTDFLFPNLEGLWTFVYHVNAEAVDDIILLGNQWSFTSQMLRLSGRKVTQTAEGIEVWYAVASYFPPPEIVLIGTITCKLVDVDGQLQGPACTLSQNGFWFDGFGVKREFHFPLGGLGAYRIFGETDDGHTFEAVKIDSTIFNS